MEFDRFKAAWQEQKFEGYLFEKPPSRIVADVRRKAIELKRRHAAEDATHVIGSIVIAGIWIIWYDGKQPLLTRIGLIVMIAGVAIEVLAYLVARFRHRAERFDLPRGDFLLRERIRIEERVRSMRGSLTWLSIPMLAGCVIYMASIVGTIGEFLSCLAIIAVLWGITFWVNMRRIRKHLLPVLAEINQKLAESKG